MSRTICSCSFKMSLNKIVIFPFFHFPVSTSNLIANVTGIMCVESVEIAFKDISIS